MRSEGVSLISALRILPGTLFGAWPSCVLASALIQLPLLTIVVRLTFHGEGNFLEGEILKLVRYFYFLLLVGGAFSITFSDNTELLQIKHGPVGSWLAVPTLLVISLVNSLVWVVLPASLILLLVPVPKMELIALVAVWWWGSALFASTLAFNTVLSIRFSCFRKEYFPSFAFCVLIVGGIHLVLNGTNSPVASAVLSPKGLGWSISGLCASWLLASLSPLAWAGYRQNPRTRRRSSHRPSPLLTVNIFPRRKAWLAFWKRVSRPWAPVAIGAVVVLATSFGVIAIVQEIASIAVHAQKAGPGADFDSLEQRGHLLQSLVMPLFYAEVLVMCYALLRISRTFPQFLTLWLALPLSAETITLSISVGALLSLLCLLPIGGLSLFLFTPIVFLVLILLPEVSPGGHGKNVLGFLGLGEVLLWCTTLGVWVAIWMTASKLSHIHEKPMGILFVVPSCYSILILHRTVRRL